MVFVVSGTVAVLGVFVVSGTVAVLGVFVVSGTVGVLGVFVVSGTVAVLGVFVVSGTVAVLDRNFCQDTCFLSGAKNKIFTNQKARFKADMMNMHSVSIGSFHT